MQSNNLGASSQDWQQLIERIRTTLSSIRYEVSKIPQRPSPFIANDDHIFGELCEAVLTSQTGYMHLKTKLPQIKTILFNYDIGKIAALSDVQVGQLYRMHVAPLRIPSRISVEKKLPKDDGLLEYFSRGKFKLKGAGVPICCEFFNNIGNDEFKPDVHTIRFLSRVGKATDRKPDGIRRLGIQGSQALGSSRKYVDSHIWVFCAEGEGKICTENDPKCSLCQLRVGEPLCKGLPSDAEIAMDPVAAVGRFKECLLTLEESCTKLKRAGLDPARIKTTQLAG